MPVISATDMASETGKPALLRQVVVDHHADELLEPDPRLPAEDVPRLARVTDQHLDLGRTHEARVLRHECGPVVDADPAERDVKEVADRVRLTGCDDIVVRLVLLQHSP